MTLKLLTTVMLANVSRIYSCRGVHGNNVLRSMNDLPRSQYVPSYSRFLHSHNGPESVDIQMPPC